MRRLSVTRARVVARRGTSPTGARSPGSGSRPSQPGSSRCSTNGRGHLLGRRPRAALQRPERHGAPSTADEPDPTFALAPIDQAVLERAVEVQGLLAEVGAHRGASVPDVIIAAAAEAAAAGLTVLHYDADYDLIASVTGQPTEWVVARGEVS